MELIKEKEMHPKFKEILERINDPMQVKNIWDTPNAIFLPAIVNLNERLEEIEKMLTPAKCTRGEYDAWKERKKE